MLNYISWASRDMTPAGRRVHPHYGFNQNSDSSYQPATRQDIIANHNDRYYGPTSYLYRSPLSGIHLRGDPAADREADAAFSRAPFMLSSGWGTQPTVRRDREQLSAARFGVRGHSTPAGRSYKSGPSPSHEYSTMSAYNRDRFDDVRTDSRGPLAAYGDAYASSRAEAIRTSMNSNPPPHADRYGIAGSDYVSKSIAVHNMRRYTPASDTPAAAPPEAADRSFEQPQRFVAGAGYAAVSRQPSAHFLSQVRREEVYHAPSFTAAGAFSEERGRRALGSPIKPCVGQGLLPPTTMAQSRPLLVLDLDETLVHASVEPCCCDFSFNVAAAGQNVKVYIKLRPHVNEFLHRMAQLFEVCIFTASLSPYADRVIDHLDPTGRLVHHRLFREHCTPYNGSYTKDLSRLGRPLERLCLVDNSPITYTLQPGNGVPIGSWFDDPHDCELLRLIPALEHFAACGNFYETARRFGIRPVRFGT